ncbi:hypothetical protein COX93_00580 [Candidatus Nomurabacteria bacterium CG_4_10_14_0_2_um_filter_30_12]|uniref:Uncharacterized protein n=2 Tax=Candidatus Nomuraibacteriota TaxID=1752729 RepID=A0A1J4V3I2_9BACT|nr:MAG: hypothetical protein AUJ22_01970 [Candidatus Nomurabacteria bacterium CG1_02_31_12]PIZ87604.1 MAG: hypothetical protein COX93_00580 [Candidatus Nomurabacteria bacterium CG_4_10_14_0_2_um_filter_30_12]
MKNGRAQKTKKFNELQLLEFSNAVSMEVCRYLVNGEITSIQLQKKLIEKKNLVQEVARDISQKYFVLISEDVMKAKELLTKFFLEVFNFRINLSKAVFPEKEGFSVYMLVPPQFRGKEDMVIETGAKKFGVDFYKYQNPIASNIDRVLEQKRPNGLYVFAHRGGDEPDAEHLGKSYDDAMSVQMIFANPLEYLLLTLFHKWLNGKFMDVKGWTRTSSLWSGGVLVNGCWRSSDGKLRLGSGDHDNRGSGGGPRQLIL